MIKIVESKSFIVALLSVIASVAMYWGFNIPIAAILAMVTPLMVATGAAGWSDVTETKARLTLQHAMKMHAMMHGHAYDNATGTKRDTDGRIIRPSQSGFARVSIMVVIVSVLGVGISTSLLATETGCATVKPVATDVIQCVKAEGIVVSDGYSILQIASMVWSVIDSGIPGVLQAIEKLALDYGPDVIACAIDNYPETTPVAVEPGAGSGSGSATTNMSVTVLTAAKKQHVETKHMLLQKLYPGKTIEHGKTK